MQRCDVVVLGSIVAVSSTGQFEPMGSLGQLDSSVRVRVGCVR